ncbi:conserved hypothetical protein [Candidatus Glomeribacter gigasporarum BEG34]|uniref:Tfp pilus assembly protein PilV n=1 Tax=Candidatus Glomeribacter gigasporarum BEG34 TaxID=1070319 RepID=G2J8C3_9BURK|nr:hypothetical protein [Candidatus Glomeribacter gigasporarum]CCD29020.1 conserved hypothetical protein [Candidatus Glomeribacter gigasporarum BEG34]
MKRHLPRCAYPRQTGDTLLEIALALWLIGIAALGAIRLQLWAERAHRAALWRIHAAYLADTAAEALRSGAATARVTAAGNARAAARLPGGGMRIVDQGPEIRLIVVHWNEIAPWPEAQPGNAQDCPPSGTDGMTRCLFVTVAK